MMMRKRLCRVTLSLGFVNLLLFFFRPNLDPIVSDDQYQSKLRTQKTRESVKTTRSDVETRNFDRIAASES